MGAKTGIEWTEATWNPVAGCSVVSAGCTNCYAMKMAARLAAMGAAKYAGLTEPSKAGAVWNGKVRLDYDALRVPLRWQRPRRIFVNSMSDLFHCGLADHEVDLVFAVMAMTPQHRYQVLTKRASRMRQWVSGMSLPALDVAIVGALHALPGTRSAVPFWPLRNVWLGVSVEDQKRADERLPHLRDTPAALRWISAEPLLGRIDLGGAVRWLDWVVVGGESGPGARPMHPDWVRSIRDQCAAAGVPFFFKQWGAWRPLGETERAREWMVVTPDGRIDIPDEISPVDEVGEVAIVRAGGKNGHDAALLDGRTHREWPA